ncbi:Uncharacterized protein QTN25_009682 [Entamoeba marina]
MNELSTEESIKICFVGDKSVGKTCIVNRYIHNEFDENERMTLGVNFISTIATIRGYTRKISIWDTAGEEKFRSLIDLYFRNASAVFLVYDVTNHETFEHLGYWLERVRNVEPEAHVVIIGNKIDQTPKSVSSKEGEKFSLNNGGLTFIEVSALDGTNVLKAFELLFEKIDCPKEVIRQLELEQTQTNGCC